MVDLELYSVQATRDSLPDMLAGVQVLADAVDRLSTRYMLQEIAAQMGIPMVHGAIGGWAGQVMTIMPGDAGLRALYGPEPGLEQGVEAELGTPSASPMMVAAWQIHEVIKILLNQGSLLRGKLLFLDAFGAQVLLLETEPLQAKR
jgi:molybdopterin/thiamine biosynthesis adenylyltransferase